MTEPLDVDVFQFADGSGGHVCDLGTAPNAGEWDVLCVNSNTTVSTPSGWTLAESAVANQGAYVFVRQAAGGEASTVTITTSGNHNTSVLWSRWPSSLVAVDTSTNTQANASVGGSTPAHSTGTLAERGELVLAFAALHSIQSANQSSPSWSAGYTAVAAGVQGSGASGVRGYLARKSGAGTAAESPQVSWSGDGAFNRYMLTVSITVSAVVDGTLAGAAPTGDGAVSGDIRIDGTLTGAAPTGDGAASGDIRLDGALASTAPTGDGAFAVDADVVEPGVHVAGGRAASTLTPGGRPS